MITRRELLLLSDRRAGRASAARADGDADPHRRNQQLFDDPAVHGAVPHGLAARGRGEQRRRRLARPQGRSHLARRRRQARRCDPAGDRAGVQRKGRAADGDIPVQRRAGGRRIRAAQQGAVRRRRAADRRDGVGKGQPLHVPAAPEHLHAVGDAGRRSRPPAGANAGRSWRRTTSTASRRWRASRRC